MRVGAVYALQRLALNSRVDRSVIAEILTGYLTARTGPTAPQGLATVTPDVQTALTVLWRLPEYERLGTVQDFR